jgi:predicted dienelactone hydrolase
MRKYACVVASVLLWCGATLAGPVGEMHRTTTTPTAALRDAKHSPVLRVTIWYPTRANAVEQPLEIGPPGHPLFSSGKAAADSPIAQGRHRVILLSHGFGGTARMMGWFGTGLAQIGYIVVAVDHPGNNGMEPITVAGASLWWERADDLGAALAVVKSDAVIGPHLDLEHLGVAGFSAGGFTSLVAAGARVDTAHYLQFCTSHPDDAVCMPQKEAPELTPKLVYKQITETPALAEQLRHAGDDHSIPGIRAVFVMAPAIVQALDPAGLGNLKQPVRILLGDADVVAPPATNGYVAAKLLPHVSMRTLPSVGHYDFLGNCTDAGRQAVPLCAVRVPQENTHEDALNAARAFFAKAL